jgi:peptidoglycan/LPS O-acetylase OafA/YrhL
MSPAVSVALDLLRWLAALTVALAHMTQPYFSRNWPDLTWVGVGAVGVFFVISGFVIRFVATERETALPRFAIARLARLWSVVLPAIAVTVFADLITAYANPTYYDFWRDQASYPLVRIILCLLFLNQVYGHDISLFSDGPIWSLGYEAVFYASFAALYFLRGQTRAVTMVAILAIVGPNVFVLSIPWLLGERLHAYSRRHKIGHRLGIAALLLLPLSIAATVAACEHGDHLVRILWRVDFALHGKSAWFPLFYMAGLSTGLLLIAVIAFEDYLSDLARRCSATIRALASATFSIYLYHFPLLVLAGGVLGYDRSSASQKTGVFLAVIASCYALAQVTEAKKAQLARRIAWAWATVRGARSAAAPR